MPSTPDGYRWCSGECKALLALNLDNFAPTGYKDSFRCICRECRRARHRKRSRHRRHAKGQKPRGSGVNSKCLHCDHLAECRVRVQLAWNVICETRTEDDVVRTGLRAEGLR